MKTTYHIILHPNKGAPQTILNTDTFQKDVLQKCFDEKAKTLEIGEELEYMKVDKIRCHPCLLNVEMTKTGLVTYTNSGAKKKYHTKF